MKTQSSCFSTTHLVKMSSVLTLFTAADEGTMIFISSSKEVQFNANLCLMATTTPSSAMSEPFKLKLKCTVNKQQQQQQKKNRWKENTKSSCTEGRSLVLQVQVRSVTHSYLMPVSRQLARRHTCVRAHSSRPLSSTVTSSGHPLQTNKPDSVRCC